MSGAKNCPETPRQKMIGMMYLVLTAMLALNVSTDVLNAFKLVDDSLHSTLSSTESRNQAMMNDFRAIRDDNPQKAGEWYDKAVELTERSDSLYNFIQNFKYQVALATDGPKKADPEARTVEGKDNRDVTTHYAMPDVGEQPGVILKNQIIDYRNYLISLDSLRAAEYNAIFSTDDKIKEDGDVATWEEQMFHDMPSGAVLPLMTKLQNDIRNAQSTLIQYLREQTDAGDVRVNKLQALVVPKSDYVLRGGKYRATIVLAGVDSTKTPEYYVNGMRLGADGVYEAVASSLGHQKYSGYIAYADPSGDMKKLEFSSDYTVAQPAVTVSNTELNIMYRSHDNKFAISVPGVSNDKIKVSVGGASVKQSGDAWIIVPGESVNSVKISVSAEMDGKMLPMGSVDYRVKNLPPPSAYFSAAGKEYANGSKIPYARLEKGELIASYGPDGLLSVPWTITSFAATISGITLNSKTNKFTKEQLNRMSKLDNGAIILLSEIYAVGEKGVKKRLDNFSIMLN